MSRTASFAIRGRRIELHLADALDWLGGRERESIHAVVTDPPYGLVEFEPEQLAKREEGRRGVWRNPPEIGGCRRSPLPRFTVPTRRDRERLHGFFRAFGERLLPVLVPGAHVFLASQPLLSHVVASALEEAGLEKRGVIVRPVSTLRGGDRPKGAHEPWPLFRRPLEGTVRDNLAKWGTGALRRPSRDVPFRDVIACGPARGRVRALVRAALPLGTGVVLDPFAGSGSTLAAAAAVGVDAIGIERDPRWFDLAREAIPRLAALDVAD